MCSSWSGAEVTIYFYISDACRVCIDTAVIRYPLQIYKRRKMCFCFALHCCAWSQVTPKLLGNYRAHNNKLTPKMRCQNLCMSCRLVCGKKSETAMCEREMNTQREREKICRTYFHARRITHRDDPYKIWFALLRFSTLPYKPYTILNSRLMYHEFWFFTTTRKKNLIRRDVFV